MVEFDEHGGMDLIGILPSIVTLGISLPFDQILQGLVASPSQVSADLLHLIFFFSIN